MVVGLFESIVIFPASPAGWARRVGCRAPSLLAAAARHAFACRTAGGRRRPNGCRGGGPRGQYRVHGAGSAAKRAVCAG